MSILFHRCCLLFVVCGCVVGAAAADENRSANPAVTYQELPAASPRPVRLQADPTTLQKRAVIILSTVFSPDGTHVTTVDGHGHVAQWDLTHPGDQQSLLKLERELACAALSHDAQWLAFAEQDGSVSIRELATGQFRLKTGRQAPRTVALEFSADGSRLAGVTEAGEVRLWSVQHGEQLRIYRVPRGGVQTAAFSTDGNRLAVASFGQEVRLMDLASLDEPKTIDAGPSRVTAVAFLHDNRRLAIAFADGAARIHDLAEDAKPVSLGTQAFAVWRFALDEPGERLAAASWDGMVRIWDTGTWELLQAPKIHEQSISALAFGPRGDLVSASLDGRLQYSPCAIPSRQATAMIRGRADSVWVSVYSSDGQTLFVGGRAKRFELWDIVTHQLLVSRDGHPTTRCAMFSPDNKTLVTGGDNGVVSLWDARTGELRQELRRHPGAVSAVVFTSKGDTLVSGCDGGVVKVWNVSTGIEKASWHEHAEQIYCANISPDDKWLLTGGGNWTSDAHGELFVWDLATGRVVTRVDGHRLAVWTIAFTPDGRRFATSCSTGEVKVWDFDSLAEIRNLPHSSWTRALSFSPDGSTLAVGLGDNSVCLWDTSNWRQVASLDGHESFVFHLQFAPDGHTLATSGNDGAVRFWATGR